MTRTRKSAREREAWLALTPEEAIEPELPICDPHHHLWKHEENPYLVEALVKDTGGGHSVAHTVFVECMSEYRQRGAPSLQPVGETEFVHDLTAHGAGEIVSGIVGFADLSLGSDVEPVLEAHLEAGGGRFCGIRHASGFDTSPEIRNSHTQPSQGLLLDAGFRRGFAYLEKLDLSFDAWLYHPQLADLTALARAFPNVTIVLDHVGGPLGVGPYAGKRKEVFDHWREGICELATCANVVVKLGGLAMPICGFGWHQDEVPPGSVRLAEATAPYYRLCIEQFGPDRCMFESNFPVDKVSCSYTVLWNSFKYLTRDYSADERQALFHDTATRVYSLAV